jgi:hypothetical protein
MQPDMVLVPADLSALRSQDPQIALTPDQWRLLTRVDGQTSLQQACQLLVAPPEIICQVAGELIALGLIHIVPPGSSMVSAFPVSSQAQEGVQAVPELVQNNSHGMHALAPAVYGMPAIPVTPDVLPQYSPVQHDIHDDYDAHHEYNAATQSQWGNGANGATFVPRQGWVAPAPLSLQPLHPTTPAGAAGIYAHASSVR